MENASKALIMAGGVLIAVAVISVALYFYTTAKGYASASEDLLSSSQIQSFNRFYTTYKNTTPLRVVDALNIANRAIEDGVEVDVSSIGVISGQNVDGVAGYDYYTADSTTLLNILSTYNISYNPEGKVSKVTIGN